MSQVQAPPDYCVEHAPTDTIGRIAWAPLSCAIPLLGCCSWDGSVSLWEFKVGDGQIHAEPFKQIQYESPVLGLSISSDGRVFFGACNGAVMQWSLADEGDTPVQVGGHELAVSGVSYVEENVPGPMLITCSWDGHVRFWDTESADKNPQVDEDFECPVIDMDCVRAAPLCVFLFGRFIFTYNVENFQRLERFDTSNTITHCLRSISAFSSQGGFAVGSAEGRIEFKATVEELSHLGCIFKAHMNEDERSKGVFDAYSVNFVRVHPNGGTAFTGGGDGTLRCWNIAKRHRIHESPAKRFQGKNIAVTAGEFSPGGDFIAYACGYDWSQGAEGYDANVPITLWIKPIKDEWMLDPGTAGATSRR